MPLLIGCSPLLTSLYHKQKSVSRVLYAKYGLLFHSKGGVDFLYDIINFSETKITEAGTTRNSGNKTTYSDRSPSSANNNISNFAENVKESSESEELTYRKLKERQSRNP